MSSRKPRILWEGRRVVILDILLCLPLVWHLCRDVRKMVSFEGAAVTLTKTCFRSKGIPWATRVRLLPNDICVVDGLRLVDAGVKLAIGGVGIVVDVGDVEVLHLSCVGEYRGMENEEDASSVRRKVLGR